MGYSDPSTAFHAHAHCAGILNLVSQRVTHIHNVEPPPVLQHLFSIPMQPGEQPTSRQEPLRPVLEPGQLYNARGTPLDMRGLDMGIGEAGLTALGVPPPSEVVQLRALGAMDCKGTWTPSGSAFCCSLSGSQPHLCLVDFSTRHHAAGPVTGTATASRTPHISLSSSAPSDNLLQANVTCFLHAAANLQLAIVNDFHAADPASDQLGAQAAPSAFVAGNS